MPTGGSWTCLPVEAVCTGPQHTQILHEFCIPTSTLKCSASISVYNNIFDATEMWTISCTQ